MSYQPEFTITPALLARVEAIAAVRERILGAAVEVPWVPALQKDSRARNAHSSTAIEGNPLTLEQVRAVEDGRELVAVYSRAQREVVNYFAALRHIEKHAAKSRITQEDILRLHKIIAGQVMDQGEAGRYRETEKGTGPTLFGTRVAMADHRSGHGRLSRGWWARSELRRVRTAGSAGEEGLRVVECAA